MIDGSFCGLSVVVADRLILEEWIAELETVIEQVVEATDYLSAAVTVDSSHMTASSSFSWSRFSPPSNFVDGHVSTMWFVVCHWPQSQEGDWARPDWCKLA